MCPPIVCLMVNHSVMVGGGESKWEENEGSRKCIKSPLPLNGCYPVRLSSDPRLWRHDMLSTGAFSQHVQMWYITQVFTHTILQIACGLIKDKTSKCHWNISIKKKKKKKIQVMCVRKKTFSFGFVWPIGHLQN